MNSQTNKNRTSSGPQSSGGGHSAHLSGGKPLIQGVYTALITPFQETGAIDERQFKRLLDQQAEAGIQGVVVCGTTGESPTLSLEEKKSLITTAVQHLQKSPVRVFAGTGSNDTTKTVEFSRWASDQGVDGLLVVAPYYNKPSQKGLLEHFRAVADSVNVPIMLYNVPGRTGVAIHPETTFQLSQHARIQAMKEATGDVTQVSELLHRTRQNEAPFQVFSGDDSCFLASMALGASGVVSVISNLFPKEWVQLFHSTTAGRWDEARELHQRFYPLVRDLFIESNPSPAKTVYSALFGASAKVRAPLVPLQPANAETLMRSLRFATGEER